MDEIACNSANGSVTLRTESLPFSAIPGQSKLFAKYQTDPLSLKKYYPSAVISHTEIAARIPEVIENHTADRSVLCDALEEMNRRFNAPEKTLDNISLLRKPDTVAVVTGQQAGLFSGPLYTIYKALSAIKMSECLRERGFNVVSVFWAATEDHDYEEVSKAFVIDRVGELGELKNDPAGRVVGQPVGYVQLDESINETVRELFDELPAGEFTEELRSTIEGSWRPENYFGDAFAELMTKLFGKYGLIILCPLDKRLKKLASPIYAESVRRSDEIVDALLKRSDELSADGFHSQVQITEDYFPLFWQDDDGIRNALRKTGDDQFQTKGRMHEFTRAELVEIAEAEPARFSPSVVLRSVVQDHLLPTACYFGGSAEIAYFAQSGEVYRILGRPHTPILHRQSFTVIEPKHAKVMKAYDLGLPDLFPGMDELLPRIVEEFLNKDSAAVFSAAQKSVDAELDTLAKTLSRIDGTLVDNLENRRRKINYHIDALRHKFHLAEMRKDEVIERRIRAMFAALFPHSGLQERVINVTYFLDRYGEYFTDWIYQAVDLDDKGHRIVYLQ